ncbi:kinase-like protein [Gigaspora margarita]|uniref:Kinase-like protein n=1 Tax=Gigaspora margarita TaxID=4874 RepID=A0A8H4ANC9_GIGMA|nr:kinase-like protein [Gigaspora margarita]
MCEITRENTDWFQNIINTYGLNVIPSDSLIATYKLGRGCFGTVYRAILGYLDYVAIKIVGSEMDKETERLFMNELQQLSRQNHERIIKFYGLCLSKYNKKSTYLVMEYAENGNLREYLRNNLEWPEKIRLAKQITEGMSYLHDLDIIHYVKISDFSKNLNSIATSIGIIPFIDPQKLKDSRYLYDRKSDIYSIGVIMWEISSNVSAPFRQKDRLNDLRSSIINGSREEPITRTPARYIILYSKCWNNEPCKRPPMKQNFQQLNSLELDPKYDGTNQVL